MLTWIVLFALVVIISTILAYKSMADYQENPFKSAAAYSIFLIRQPQALTIELINELHQKLSSGKLLMSLERLQKGEKSALVIFGPVAIMRSLTSVLSLLELEDYSQKKVENKDFLSWEVGTKNLPDAWILPEAWDKNLPDLQEDEEFWWQVVLRPKGNLGVISEDKQKNSLFEAEIRGVIWASGKNRALDLQGELFKIGKLSGFLPLPQAFASDQLVKFYQERSLPQTRPGQFAGRGNPLVLAAKEIQKVAGF